MEIAELENYFNQIDRRITGSDVLLEIAKMRQVVLKEKDNIIVNNHFLRDY